MRSAFISELAALAEKHTNIALVVGDLGYSVVEPFADRFPERFINAGVAEQNMTGLAAGMASEGYHVFTYSIANFPTFRCAEQIRNDVDYQSLSVTIVAVGGGLGYGALGYSHHAVQDYALMRCLPNMLIAAPGDVVETRACMRYLVKHPGPSYLRLGRNGGDSFHREVPEVAPGEWLGVSEKCGNNSKILLSTGGALDLAMNLHSKAPYKDYSVMTLPLWGMKYKFLQFSQMLARESVVTIEDHLADCGFGSWLSESIASFPDLRGRIQSMALDSQVCGLVGSQDFLNALGGLK